MVGKLQWEKCIWEKLVREKLSLPVHNKVKNKKGKYQVDYFGRVETFRG